MKSKIVLAPLSTSSLELKLLLRLLAVEVQQRAFGGMGNISTQYGMSERSLACQSRLFVTFSEPSDILESYTRTARPILTAISSFSRLKVSTCLTVVTVSYSLSNFYHLSFTSFAFLNSSQLIFLSCIAASEGIYIKPVSKSELRWKILKPRKTTTLCWVLRISSLISCSELGFQVFITTTLLEDAFRRR